MCLKWSTVGAETGLIIILYIEIAIGAGTVGYVAPLTWKIKRAI